MRSFGGLVTLAGPAVGRRFAAVAATLGVLAVLTGCGGSSHVAASAASTATKGQCDPEPCQLTHAQLAAKLDALCLRGDAAVNRADASFKQATKASDYTNAAVAMESALSEFPPYENAIQDLAPSAQDRAAFARYADLTGRIHGLSERIVAAGRARDTSEAIHVSQLVQKELATRTRAAADLGTKHCGS